jgi:ankyrin repeat protein/L-ascorbate metabolism protein UlaG (beta-lactamase superfamily)
MMTQKPLRTALLVALAVGVALSLFPAAPAGAGEIHRAIAQNDRDAVARLLARDTGLVRAPDEEDRFASLPMHLAAIQGNVEITRLLLEAGADVDCGDSDESTPLDVAALNRKKDLVEFLISRGADVNRRDKNGAYSLSFAASGGDTAIVRVILAAGADLNYRSAEGTTLLHMAASRGLNGLCDALFARGADMNAANGIGQTPLHWVAMGRRPEMVTLLLDHGANIAALDEHGETPLTVAAFSDRLEAAQILLDRGADPNAAMTNGVTPLFVACWQGKPDLARALIAKGADVNHKDQDGKTSLLAAADRGNAELVGILLDAGADCRVADPKTGATPLHLAAARGYGEVAGLLLTRGALADAKENEGRTPIQLAETYGHRGLVGRLKAAGSSTAGLVPGNGAFADQPKVNGGEAVVWSLGHSSWAIRTKSHVLVFDYAPAIPPADEPGLANGRVVPEEIAGERVAVFASHEHRDHYDAEVFGWRDKVKDVAYVMGFQPPDVSGYEFVGPHEAKKIQGMKVSAIRSNDSGAGFLVEVDGLVIFHAGDHANRTRDFSGPYKEEIEWLAARGVRPDMAFFPVSGCGFGDQEAVRLGVEYALETLQPAAFFPMHGGASGTRCREFGDACKPNFPGIQVYAAQNPGDHFIYRKGKVS